MNYKDFLKSYAKENGFKFSQLDENTYKLNSANGLLKAYFREDSDVLDGWGSFIEFSQHIALNDLKEYLNNQFKNNKMVISLDCDYNVVKQEEVPALASISKNNFTAGIDYCLMSDFFAPAKLYKKDNNDIKECQLFKINNPIEQTKQILNKRKISYKATPVYLGELETFDKLVVDQGATELHITSNFCGTKLKLERESKELDFSVYKSKVINLNEEKLEDINLQL